jgi:hypothetical protein
MDKCDSLKWLQERTEKYRLEKNDMGEIIDDFDDLGKLGQGSHLLMIWRGWTLEMGVYRDLHMSMPD